MFQTKEQIKIPEELSEAETDNLYMRKSSGQWLVMVKDLVSEMDAQSKKFNSLNRIRKIKKNRDEECNIWNKNTLEEIKK